MPAADHLQIPRFLARILRPWPPGCY